MASCPFPHCILAERHGGDFHVGPPVEPDNPSRRHMWPKAEARAAVVARLGPGPYVGRLQVEGEVVDPDEVYRKRAGLDQLDGLQ